MDDAKAVSEVKAGLSWLQKHERIVLVFMVLLVGGFLGNRYLNNAASDTKTKYDIAKSQLDDVRSQAAAAKTDYLATVDALTKQNAALATAVAQRQVVLQQRQETAKTAPLPEVAIRWQDIIGGSGDLVSSTDGVAVTEAGARKTVSMLEQVPVLIADKTDLAKMNDNLNSELLKGSIAIDALNQTITKADATCKLQVAEVKAAARKSKRNWFIAGFVSGLATRVFLKF